MVTATAGILHGGVTADAARLPRQPTPTRRPAPTGRIRNFGGGSCGGALFQILRVSCNTAFAQMGVDTGPDPMIEVSQDFGFNQAVPIDLTAPARSNFPTDFEQNLPALAQSAIGQNDVAATPLQMAMVAAAVANGGEVMAPHVLRDVRDPDGNVVGHLRPRVWTTAMDQATADLMREAMRGVVESGTGHPARSAGLRRGRQDGYGTARHRAPALARVDPRVRRSTGAGADHRGRGDRRGPARGERADRRPRSWHRSRRRSSPPTCKR